MPVLLLARGDSTAKDLLRTAIEARYGFRPPALETLELKLVGRIRSQIGPVTTWLPIELTTRLKFPLSIYWEYVIRPLKLPVRRGTEAFDGMVFRRLNGGDPAVITDHNVIGSVQKRLWAISALLLTPLTEHFVELHTLGEHSFEATNKETDDSAQVFLNEDNTISHVQIRCYNPQKEEEQVFKLALSGGHVTLNDLILPIKITIYWNDEPHYEFKPIAAKVNPELTDSIFAMDE